MSMCGKLLRENYQVRPLYLPSLHLSAFPPPRAPRRHPPRSPPPSSWLRPLRGEAGGSASSPSLPGHSKAQRWCDSSPAPSSGAACSRSSLPSYRDGDVLAARVTATARPVSSLAGQTLPPKEVVRRALSLDPGCTRQQQLGSG